LAPILVPAPIFAEASTTAVGWMSVANCGGSGANNSKTKDIAKSAFFTLIKALFSPGSIEISSLTMAAQALEFCQNFSYFLFPIKEISVSFAHPNCSGAVIECEVFPTIVPLTTLFMSSIE
jgi:hypothetical protein